MKWVLGMLALFVVTALAPARTFTLTTHSCDRMAILSADVPAMSWCQRTPKGILFQTERLDFGPGMAIIMRFPMESIPKNQRILKAELTLMCEYVAGAPKLQVHRLLADWGPGVSHKYYR